MRLASKESGYIGNESSRASSKPSFRKLELATERIGPHVPKLIFPLQGLNTAKQNGQKIKLSVMSHHVHTLPSNRQHTSPDFTKSETSSKGTARGLRQHSMMRPRTMGGNFDVIKEHVFSN